MAVPALPVLNPPPPACTTTACRTGTAIPDGTKLGSSLPSGVTAMSKELVVDVLEAFHAYAGWLPGTIVSF